MVKYVMALFIGVVCLNPLKSSAQNIDVDILKSINKNETSLKNDFFKADVQSVLVINMAAPISIFAAGLIKHDKKLQLDAAYIAGAYVLSTIITQTTKRIVNRTRPFAQYSFIVKRDDETPDYSFPSGHTSSAFCTATSLSLYFPKWYVIAPSYLWAASVGWARMYQGVHYPSDVLAGAIIGTGSAWLGYKVQKWMDKKQQLKKTPSVPIGN